MIPLRKEHAGSCNLGYTWPEDGSVVEVTPEHAVLLLAVPDGDFTAVDSAPAAEATPEPESEPADTAIEEPAPEASISESPAPRAATAAQKRAAKKSAAPEPPAAVEE